MHMTDPAVTTTAATWAVAAGIVSATLAPLGVTAPLLWWALCGAMVGAGFAPTVGRWRAMSIFPAVVMLSAKGGVLAGAALGAVGALQGEPLAQALAGLIGIGFHPITTTGVRLLPAVASARLGVPPGNAEEPKP